jgi:hypothetical protein
MSNQANLASFAHELDRHGHSCASYCPACRWARDERAQELLAQADRYKDCELFQIGLRALALEALAGVNRYKECELFHAGLGEVSLV